MKKLIFLTIQYLTIKIKKWFPIFKTEQEKKFEESQRNFQKFQANYAGCNHNQRRAIRAKMKRQGIIITENKNR